MPSIAHNWHLVPFGDVVQNVRVKVDPETSGLERYVTGAHMETDDLHIRQWGTIGDGYLGPAFHRKFVKGQVLYGSRRTYLRKVAVAEFDGVCANTTFVLEPKDDRLLPELLPFIMQTEAFTQHSIQQSKGSVNPYVNWKDLAWYEFPLLPLDEQRRIAEILWAADAAVQKVGKAVEAILSLMTAIKFEVFARKDRTSSTRLVDLCEPDGMQIGPFGSQLHVSDYVEDEDGIPVIMPSDMSDESVILDSIAKVAPETAERLSLHRVLPGDILLPRRGELDRRAFIRPEQAGWICGTGSIRLRLKDSVSARAVFYAISAPQTVLWLERNAVGTTMPNLNTKIVSDVPIRLPEKQEQVVETLDALGCNLALAQSHVARLVELRRKLTSDLTQQDVLVRPNLQV